MSLLLASWLAKSTTAEAPTIQTQDYTSDDITIKDNALNRTEPTSLEISSGLSKPSKSIPSKKKVSNGHSTGAEKQISEEALKTYLSKSPLREYSAQLLISPYWSTIIGICTIEQYSCTHAPYNNYWGIMGRNGLQRFASLGEAIQAIDSLLAKYEANGHDTIEELNGYYVQPASDNWLRTVIRTKQAVEALQ